ncbi:MAG: ankyrin repeat domain-containing protein [Lentisphaerae bacterium]|nr:ankyrin repeat domain-containing protein [Lentisphaerota bacterium]
MKYVNWLFGKNGALFRAAATGQLDLVKELIANGADANVKSATGYTPLHRAAQNGHREVVEFLLECNANPNTQTKDHLTPAALAEQSQHIHIVQILQAHM